MSMWKADQLAKNAVGKPCGICGVEFFKFDQIFVGLKQGRVFHKDCYEIVEKHQHAKQLLNEKTVSLKELEEQSYTKKLFSPERYLRK